MKVRVDSLVETPYGYGYVYEIFVSEENPSKKMYDIAPYEGQNWFGSGTFVAEQEITKVIEY